MTEMEQIMKRLRDEVLTFLPNEQAKEGMENGILFLMLVS